jgi:hypothetical protein
VTPLSFFGQETTSRASSRGCRRRRLLRGPGRASSGVPGDARRETARPSAGSFRYSEWTTYHEVRFGASASSSPRRFPPTPATR